MKPKRKPREHVLTKDCWCQPRVIKVARQGKKSQLVRQQREVVGEG